MIKTKSGNDFTKGNITESLLKFSFPFIIGSFAMQFYNWCDAIIVGRFISDESLAAVGASYPFIFTLIALGMGVSIGGSILISGFYAKKDYEKIHSTANTLYLTLFILGLVITIIGHYSNEYIMSLLSLPQSVLPLAISYLDIYILSIVFTFGFTALTAILRGVGDSITPLKFLIGSSILNIVLDIIFVCVFEWGITGAAWATVISQATIFVVAILITNSRFKYISLNIFKLNLDYKLFSKSLSLGLPAGLQQIFVAMGSLTLVSIIAPFDTDVIAAYTSAQRVLMFIMVIPINISLALTSFVAQNRAVNNFVRIRQVTIAALKITFISSTAILIALSMWGTPLMKVFTDNVNIINIGKQYLMIIGLSFWIFSIMMTLMGVIRGVGNTIIPMAITLLSLWIVKIPIAKLLSIPLKEVGVWLSEPASWSIGILLTIIAYSIIIKKKRLS